MRKKRRVRYTLNADTDRGSNFYPIQNSWGRAIMPSITVETIISEIAQLSASDRVKLYKILATSGVKQTEMKGSGGSGEKIKSLPLPIPEPDPEPNRRWIKGHKTEYAGRWVDLDGDRLIAAGDTERAVAIAAKADGAYLPLIVYLPHPEEPTFVGL